MYNYTNSCFVRLLIVNPRKHDLSVLLKNSDRKTKSQRASSAIWRKCVSGLGWGSECSWWSELYSESCLWSRWQCESGSWSACRTSSSFSRMSFSVSLSATVGTTGMGKSVPLSLVSLLQRETRCRDVQWHKMISVLAKRLGGSRSDMWLANHSWLWHLTAVKDSEYRKSTTRKGTLYC